MEQSPPDKAAVVREPKSSESWESTCYRHCRRFPGCGWGAVTPRPPPPPPKQLTVNSLRVKSGNVLTSPTGEQYQEQLREQMRDFRSREPPVSGGKEGVSEVLSTPGFDGLANFPTQAEGIGGPRPVTPTE